MSSLPCGTGQNRQYIPLVSAQRETSEGFERWDEESKFVVITTPGDRKGDYGTAFSPKNGRKYFEKDLK